MKTTTEIAQLIEADPVAALRMCSVDDVERKVAAIPARMLMGIARYLALGVMPGSFLQAVISNDLRLAATRADPENLHLLRDYVLLFVNDLPDECWGDKAAMQAWCDMGGMDLNE